MLSTRHSIYNNIDRLKVKRWKNMYHENVNPKKARVAILILDKADKKSYQRKNYMIKGSILQEDIAIYMCSHQKTDAKYVNQKLKEI